MEEKRIGFKVERDRNLFPLQIYTEISLASGRFAFVQPRVTLSFHLITKVTQQRRRSSSFGMLAADNAVEVHGDSDIPATELFMENSSFRQVCEVIRNTGQPMDPN